MRLLARAAAARFAYPNIIKESVAAAERRTLREGLAANSNEQLLEKIGQATAQAIEAKSMEEMALADNARLLDESRRLSFELDSAQKELARLRRILTNFGEAEAPVPPEEIESVEEAIGYARVDFADTLIIPESLHCDTKQNGGFWYRALRALHQLCKLDREHRAVKKREVLAGLLGDNELRPKRTYKIGDTDVYVEDPNAEKRVHCRERVHLIEGKPAETESLYWHTIGEEQQTRRLLIGRMGKHA